MALFSSTSRSWIYDVFPSFRGEDVRKSFLSYLIKELHRKSIHTFIDNGIERSRPIGPELLLAIEESKIAIVVFSRNYASSTWCLNELVKIHQCSKESGQLVLPIFYDVDTSHVRKQSGEFGKGFDETCQGKTEDEKQGWKKALVAVAHMAGYDLQKCDNEADMTEKIATEVSNKLNNITPSDDFADFVGIQAHLEKLNSMLCLESEEVKMVGIVGTSGIGKSTIGRALYNKLLSQFDLRSFKPYKRAIQNRKIADDTVKLSWVKQLLSDILCQNDIKIDSLSVMKQRLKHKKVLIVLDDVDEMELLETLVGHTGWFGSGSRIIVVTQDREILRSHKIDLIYDVELPSKDLALQMFCRSAFRQNYPPEGFTRFADEVVELSDMLPLGLTVLGSSLREKNKEEWMEMLPRLRDGLYGKIEKTLRVSYDGLDRREQDRFLSIACLFNGEPVDHIKKMLGNDALRILTDRSLISIRVRPITWSPTEEIVEMHSLRETLGCKIVRAESSVPEKRRILVDAKDICNVLTDHTGTKTVEGIYFNLTEIDGPLTLAEKSFEGMHNLQFLIIFRESEVSVRYPLQGYVNYLPRRLRLLYWEEYPAKSLPSSFRGEYLVELNMMKSSKLEKLWEGTQLLANLLILKLSFCSNLKELPDLSKATNLEKLELEECTSLVRLPSSIQHLNKLEILMMVGCTSLEVLPTNISLASLTTLNLCGCSRLTSFPQISTSIKYLYLNDIAIEEVPSWIENMVDLEELWMSDCEKLRKISATVEDLRELYSIVIPDVTCRCHNPFDFDISPTRLVLTLAELRAAEIDEHICCCFLTSEFLLARGAQEFLLQSDFHYKALHGKQVPTRFTHRTSGHSLNVPLPQNSLSKRKLEFEGCVTLDLGTDIQYYHMTIFVHWKFRGVTGICRIKPVSVSCAMDHQVVFHFDIDNGDENDDPPSHLDCNGVEFEFEHHSFKYCCCYSLFSVGDLKTSPRDLRTCPIFPEKIKGCGIRVMSVSPSLYADDTSCETEYDHQSRKELDAEIENSKKQTKTTIVTSEEPSTTLCSQTAMNSGSMTPNLDLSSGICGTSAHVSSRGKVPSPSIPSRNFLHGDGPSLSPSITSSDPFPGGEYMHSEPMITEQQDAETALLDPLPSSQLINFFSQSLAPNLDLSSGPGGASSNFHGDGPLLSLSITSSDSCLGGETLYSDPMVTEQLDRGGTHCDSVILSKASKSNETEDNHQPREKNDAESEESKKRMRVTVTTPEEPSVSLCGQTVADTVLPAPTLESSLDQEIAGSDFEASVKKRGLEGGALGPSSSTPFKKLRRTHSF